MEYIQLLIEIFYHHNRKIDSSTFPLSLPQTDNGAAIKARITQYLEDSDSLREQLQTLQWVWDTNRGQHPDFECYAPGPSDWIDQVTDANAQSITRATDKITAFDRRFRQAQVETQQLEVENTRIQRERETNTDPQEPSSLITTWTP